MNHLLETSDGRIWAATHGGGVARFTGTGFVPVVEGLPDLRVWRLLEGKDSAGGRRLLAACEGGVSELREGGRWTSVDLGTSLAGVSVNSLLETGDGAERTLWAGTYGSGLFRVKGGRVTRFGPGSGLSSRLVTSLAATPGPEGTPSCGPVPAMRGLPPREESFENGSSVPRRSEVYTLAGGVGVDAETSGWGRASPGS
ncbi:MAG: hypothetical protein IPL90_11640 [Holophagales bacterium]|nr:hypothetical protein [Holophagales bacterium]